MWEHHWEHHWEHSSQQIFVHFKRGFHISPCRCSQVPTFSSSGLCNRMNGESQAQMETGSSIIAGTKKNTGNRGTGRIDLVFVLKYTPVGVPSMFPICSYESSKSAFSYPSSDRTSSSISAPPFAAVMPASLRTIILTGSPKKRTFLVFLPLSISSHPRSPQ